MADQPFITGPTRVLTFSGTVSDFLDYMDRVRGDWALSWTPADEAEEFDWEVTAAIARHPAGKGLGR
jgi:hypothetical protein